MRPDLRERLARLRPGAGGGASGLGAFAGVFTPSILTIVGVILFLRLGWVVGHAGLGGALLIVLLSSGISLLTALSIASIATDVRVRTGGAYFMISRSLGPEAGGAIGIALYLAQTFSVALYVLGFAESVERVAPSLEIRPVAAATTAAVTLVALVSSRAAMRVQFVVMALVVAGFASILLGGPVGPDAASAPTATPGDVGFWAVFAVFFPAVTGIMSGVNMSGDLERPERAIPLGTLAAVFVGLLLYAGTAVLLAHRADPAVLVAEPLVLRRMALSGDVVVLAIWASTLSSAVGSLLGAPRVLQALAQDRVLPRPLRFLGHAPGGPTTPPRRATLLTAAVCLAAVLAGGLNAVAALLTMFFLGTYAALNLVAGVETALRPPSFRPRFRVPAALPLLGGLGCLGAMLLIDPLATGAAVAVVAALMLLLAGRSLRVPFGDIRQGLWIAVTRAGLLRLQAPSVPESWRPHLLVLAGDPAQRPDLLDLAVALDQRRGFLSVAAVRPQEDSDPSRRAEVERAIRARLARERIEAMVKVVDAPDVHRGAAKLVDAYGLGAVAPDTLVLGDNEDPSALEDYGAMVQGFARAGRHVLILRAGEEGFGARRRIDLWWGGLERNGSLMLLLGHLLQRSDAWLDASLRVRTVVDDDAALEPVARNLRTLVQESRMQAEVDVILRDGRPLHRILTESSAHADLALVGLSSDRAEDFAAYYASLRERLAALPAVLFTLAAPDLPLQEAVVDVEVLRAERARQAAQRNEEG